METRLQQVLALALLIKSTDLMVRDTPMPLLAIWTVGATLLLVHVLPRLGAAAVAGTGAVLPWISDFGLWNNHLWLATILAGFIAIGAPRSLFATNVSLVYGFAVLAKLNPYFLSGWVVASSFSTAPLGRPLVDIGLAVPLAYLTICAEAFVAIGLWVSRTRHLAILMGVLLHTGMLLFMSNSVQAVVHFTVFGLLMVLAYPAFLPRTRMYVVWDDSCGFCSGWIRWFRRLDWLGVLELLPLSKPAGYVSLGVEPDAAARAIQVADLDVVRGGYDAISRIVERLPLTAPLVPVLRLLRFAGNPAYRRIASRRTCTVAVPNA